MGQCVVCARETERRVPGAASLFACGYHGGKTVCKHRSDECFGDVEDINGMQLCEVHAQEHWEET